MQKNHKPYQNALIFSGGGLRFGYYLGIYQAYYQHYKKPPDIILASCGGAIALTLLTLCPEPIKAQAFFQSYACYRMLCRIQSRVSQSLNDYAIPAIKRYLTQYNPFCSQNTLLSQQYYQSLYSQSLFQIDNEVNQPLFCSDEFTNECGQYHHQNSLNHIIILSQLHKINHNSYQWQEYLACSNNNVKDYLLNHSIQCPISNYNSVRIKKELIIDSNLPIDIAMRSSITDMYYLAPILYQNKLLFGGVLDLMPIEIAMALSDTIFIDDKANYNNFMAIPAIQTIFGFNANKRLRDLKNHHSSNIHWLPFSNNRKEIKPLLKRLYNFKKGNIQPIYPSFDNFKKQMQTQIHYGYQRSINYFQTMKKQ